MTVTVTLNDHELKAIKAQQKVGGGFQALFQSLEENLHGNELTVDRDLAEKAIRYSEDYGQGGWQSALQGIAEKLSAAMSVGN